MTGIDLPSCADFVCMLTYNNTTTNGAFGIMTLVAIFAITFITLVWKDPRQAFIAAGFVTTLASFPLAALGLVSTGVVVVLIALTAIITVSIMMNRSYT